MLLKRGKRRSVSFGVYFSHHVDCFVAISFLEGVPSWACRPKSPFTDLVPTEQTFVSRGVDEIRKILGMEHVRAMENHGIFAISRFKADAKVFRLACVGMCYAVDINVRAMWMVYKFLFAGKM
jgi:hypothetical protein